ncbi:MAG: hypothetical protein FJX72_01980 [Armatimonadetes bacterium]|nr:hypothetical protein [Armatimonadota bacterium]
MTTTELRRAPDRAAPADDIATCAFALEGLCELGDAPGQRCEACERYNDLLRQARDLYGGGRWRVNPDGLLQEMP